MDPSEIRQVLRSFREFVSDRVLADILPFLRVTLAIAKPVMKTARLKPSRIGL